jgi:hypothetical protein
MNLTDYAEFAGQNRPDGWNAWLTFAISPAAPGKAASVIQANVHEVFNFSTKCSDMSPRDG